MKRLLYLICILLAVAACKEEFEAPPKAMLQVNFLNSITKDTISSKTTMKGWGQEYLWVKDSVLQDILLPLSSNDSTRFIVSFDSVIDTITFFHQTILKYESMESGFYNEYKLRSIVNTKNRIDSVEISDSLITKNWNENIKLYLHPLSISDN